MKNREKDREELTVVLREALLNGTTCEFIKDKVFPSFLKREEIEAGVCRDCVDCDDCTRAFAFWLDEEYEEPEVDWENVPVDTLVRVRNDKSTKWLLRYFKAYEHGELAPYLTWTNGATSVTSGGFLEQWKYCELVEEKEDE